MDSIRSFREFLHFEHKKRQTLNPSFSLRSFARMLQINPGVLSHIMKGTRICSSDQIRSICEVLNTDIRLIDYFIEKNKKHISCLSDIMKFETPKLLRLLDSNKIPNIELIPLIVLLKREPNLVSPQKISKRLLLPIKDTKLLLEQIETLNLFTFDKDNQRFVPSDGLKSFSLPTNTKRVQKKLINLSDRLNNTKINDLTLFESTVFYAQPEDIEKIKTLMTQFIDRVAEICHKPLQNTTGDVYEMAIINIPHTR